MFIFVFSAAHIFISSRRMWQNKKYTLETDHWITSSSSSCLCAPENADHARSPESFTPKRNLTDSSSDFPETAQMDVCVSVQWRSSNSILDSWKGRYHLCCWGVYSHAVYTRYSLSINFMPETGTACFGRETEKQFIMVDNRQGQCDLLLLHVYNK